MFQGLLLPHSPEYEVDGFFLLARWLFSVSQHLGLQFHVTSTWVLSRTADTLLFSLLRLKTGVSQL